MNKLLDLLTYVFQYDVVKKKTGGRIRKNKLGGRTLSGRQARNIQ